MREPPVGADPASPAVRCAASSGPTSTIIAPCSARSARRGCGSRGWSSTTTQLAAIIHDPEVELFAVVDERGRGRRHARARFPRARRMRARLRRPDPRACPGKGHGRWLLAEAIGRPGATASAASMSTPARSIIRPRLSAYRRAGFTPYKRAIERFPDPRADRDPSRGLRPSGPAVGHARARPSPAS